MAKIGTQRGLKNYIQEVRNCSTLEAEKERVDKELGKIRKKYTSDKALSAYDKRKYMWKLLYTKMLGYEVDFGQKQAMDLIASQGYAEKQVGYVACGVFLNEQDELLRLVINSVRNDLISRNEIFQCLALEFVANVGGSEFAQLLTADIMNVLTNGATRPVVRKKAALCLLRLIRKAPLDVDVMPASEWAGRLAAMLEERDPGLLLGLTTLLLGIVSRNYEGYEVCVPRLVHMLERLKARDVPQDYTYYGLASPWLQVRTLRVLQYFPAPEDPALLRTLTDTLKRILAGNEPAKNANKNNAVHAIVFEAVAVAVGLGDAELLNMGVGLLARFLSVREPNLKYLALENMGRLAQAPEVAEAVGRHQKTIVACLHDVDISIRRRALDLMFTTANASTAPGVVDELLEALPHAEYALREELVLKAAVLAERFLSSPEWYVDAMLKLMEAAGEDATDDVWHSVVQLVASQASLQPYAASKVVEALKRGAASEAFLRCASFVLGEHGRQLGAAVPPLEQFQLLHARFPASAPETKAMMLTAYEKLRAAAPEDAALAAKVTEVMERYSAAADSELQQRATEYRGLSTRPGAASVALQPLPPWEKRTSLLLRRLAEREGDEDEEARERPAWMQEWDGEGGKEATEKPPVDASSLALAPAAEGEEGVPTSPPLEAAAEESATQTPVTAAAAAPVVDLLDLLDLSEPAEQPIPGSAPLAGSQQQPELENMAGLMGPVGPVASANPFADSPPLKAAGPILPIGDIGAWYRALCRGASGVLYEDPNVQVGLRITSTGASAQVGIFLGNKAGSALERVVCSVPPAPAFTLSLGAAPSFIDPGKQVHMQLEATCLAPFTAPPALQLGYSVAGVGGTVARTLELPLPVTRFCQPVDVPASVFIARWAQVAGAPFKLSAPAVVVAGPADVAGVLSSLHLRVLDGIDPTPGTLCAACVFHCGAPQARQVPCMVKIEGVGMGSGQAMVTVATADAMITDSLKTLLVQQLQG